MPALATVFREYGYEGARLTIISKYTGLGKGSLYHFFPGGKAEMAEAVLNEIGSWFETNIFLPLKEEVDPERGIRHMFHSVDEYFESGQRICLIGAFAIDNVRDLFADRVQAYFALWVKTLSGTLHLAGIKCSTADILAEQTIAEIQGALVLSRALKDSSIFPRLMNRSLKKLLLVMVEK